MNSVTPDVNVISDIKCSFASKHHNKWLEDEYFVKLCKTSLIDNRPFEVVVKEQYLKVLLLENIKWLNKINEYGKEVVNCDLNKMYL